VRATAQDLMSKCVWLPVVWRWVYLNRRVLFKWTMQQALSRHILLLHIKYDIYDSIRPAIFYRGCRVNSNNAGLVSPPTTPATVFPKDERLLLVLTSELGQGATGVVHGGILQVESEHKISKLEIAAKLAFNDEQQEALVFESSIYLHLAREGVDCIPTILGSFHDVEEDGPSCLLMSRNGKSLQDRGTSISTDEWCVVLAPRFQKEIDNPTSARHFCPLWS
jgi:hypothetical protein